MNANFEGLICFLKILYVGTEFARLLFHELVILFYCLTTRPDILCPVVLS